MTDQEAVNRFILLRSQGWSFNRIAAELDISKPTLIKWSRQHQFAIQNLRATETEALTERLFGERTQRWEALARHLQRLEAEIDKRDLKAIPASRLYGIAAALRAEIDRHTGTPGFSEARRAIPPEEATWGRHQWTP